MTDPTTVAIAICTYRRPAQLHELLRTIAESESAKDGVVSAIVVVDDSPEREAAAVVSAARASLGPDVTLRYESTASGDVSVARNRAISVARELAPYVACIDDDCLPRAGWVPELLRIARSTGAAIVVGHRQFVAPDDAPRWLRSEPFLAENAQYPDASDPTLGNVANVLLRSGWLADHQVAFRRELGVTGGEDMVFLADARAAGAQVRFAASSVVLEPLDPARCTLSYQLWRQMWLGNNEAEIDRQTGAVGGIRLLLRGGRRVGRGLAHPFVRLAGRRAPQWRWALALAGNGVGLMLGVGGVRMRHH